MTNSADSLTKPSKASKLGYAFLPLALVGLADALWLTVSYYRGYIGCNIIAGCQNVLNSSYASIFSVPVALLGAIYYAFIIISAAHYLLHNSRLSWLALKIVPTIGFLFSLYLVYLQLWVIKAICIYCMASATTATVLFFLSLALWNTAKNNK